MTIEVPAGDRTSGEVEIYQKLSNGRVLLRARQPALNPRYFKGFALTTPADLKPEASKQLCTRTRGAVRTGCRSS